MIILIIALLVVFISLCIFWNAFWNIVKRFFNALGGLMTLYFPVLTNWVRRFFRRVREALGIYILFLFLASILIFVLLVSALIANNETWTGMVFLFAIILILLAWLPVGVIRKIVGLFQENNEEQEFVPKWLKGFIAWMAFVGFLGLMSPAVFSFKALLAASLVGFVFFGIVTKINVLERLIIPLVIIMCLWAGWKYFFPEDFRSTNRYFVSWAKLKNTVFDRGSIGNETEAASTYARIVKTVNTVYEIDSDGEIYEYSITIPKDSIVRVVNHKDEVTVIDQIAFVKIQLKKANGSFVNGDKYYVEAECLEIGGRTTIDPSFQENQTSQNSVNGRVGSGTMNDPLIISGLRNFDLAGGEYSPWFGSPNGVKSGISMWSPNQDFKIHCSDGTSYPGIETIPAKKKGTCYRVEANSSQVITIMVY